MNIAVSELYRASSDRAVRREYSLRERARRDEKARMDYATQEGHREGMEEGEIRGEKKGMAKGEIKGRKEERSDVIGLLESGRSVGEILAMLADKKDE
jgi:flagellar biosynthesis/type III secretory pathway protein FliH